MLRAPADVDAAWDAARRCAADPRGVRPVRPRAVDPRRARPRRRGRAAGRSSRTSTATASCTSPRAGARRRRRAAGARRGAASAPLLDALDYVGVLAVELFDVDGTLLAERDRAARAQHGPLDDRGRGHEPVREPPARGRSAWPLGSTAARGPRAMVNCIGTMPAARRGARGPRRAPPRLRQGAAPGPQARPRHRAPPPTTAELAARASTRCAG